MARNTKRRSGGKASNSTKVTSTPKTESATKTEADEIADATPEATATPADSASPDAVASGTPEEGDDNANEAAAPDADADSTSGESGGGPAGSDGAGKDSDDSAAAGDEPVAKEAPVSDQADAPEGDPYAAVSELSAYANLMNLAHMIRTPQERQKGANLLHNAFVSTIGGIDTKPEKFKALMAFFRAEKNGLMAPQVALRGADFLDQRTQYRLSATVVAINSAIDGQLAADPARFDAAWKSCKLVKMENVKAFFERLKRVSSSAGGKKK